jgi:hypothetical protein
MRKVGNKCSNKRGDLLNSVSMRLDTEVELDRRWSVSSKGLGKSPY